MSTVTDRTAREETPDADGGITLLLVVVSILTLVAVLAT
jgi:hypothetical protein